MAGACGGAAAQRPGRSPSSERSERHRATYLVEHRRIRLRIRSCVTHRLGSIEEPLRAAGVERVLEREEVEDREFAIAVEIGRPVIAIEEVLEQQEVEQR